MPGAWLKQSGSIYGDSFIGMAGGASYSDRLANLARSSIVFAYPLVVDALDSGAGGHHGTPANVVYTETSPTGGGAALFNGLSSQIILPLTLNGAVNFDEFTFLVWIKPDTTVFGSTTIMSILHLGQDANNRILLYHPAVANRIQFLGKRNTVSDISQILTSASLANVWSSMVLTGSKTSNVYRAYINRTQIGVDATLPNNYVGGVSLYRVIGSSTGADYWKGGIWQCWCWSRMFTPAECDYIQVL